MSICQRSFSSLGAQHERHNNHIHLSNSDFQEILRAGPVIPDTWVSRRMQVSELGCRGAGSKMKALTVQARVDEKNCTRSCNPGFAMETDGRQRQANPQKLWAC